MPALCVDVEPIGVGFVLLNGDWTVFFPLHASQSIYPNSYTKDVRTGGSSTSLQSLSQVKDSSSDFSEIEWVDVSLCTLFVFLKGFYSDEESVTVVLTKHFDFLCNDDCFVGSGVIITFLGC